MLTKLTLQKYLKQSQQTEPEVTVVRLAGREVTLAQKPHVEADIKAAAAVLSRLLEVRVTFTVREIDSDE